MTEISPGLPEIRRVASNGIEINVALAGEGPAVVLLHGFPHTWRVWVEVIPILAESYRVIAPDLRGLGDTTRAPDGYDVSNLELDLLGLLDALHVEDSIVIGIDAGGPPAFYHAFQRPDRVRGAILIESLIGRLPGAEEFLAGGPPWWFGFHAVPGLAETVLEGHEGSYIDFFLRSGTTDGRGIASDLRDSFIAAYQGKNSLRCGFEHYRAMAKSAEQIAVAAESRRLTVPTMTIGAASVGPALGRQLAPIADDHSDELIKCGHIVPLDAPRELLDRVLPFLSRHVR